MRGIDYQSRGQVLIVAIGVIFFIFIVRLFTIQVLNDDYQGRAERTVIRVKPVVPPRGNIFNRYGESYVSNRPMFQLYITPAELFIPDTSVLCHYLQMTPKEIREGIAKARSYSGVKASVLARNIEPEVYGALQEKLWNFKGISFTATNKRYYNFPVGAHLLGYISEVSTKEIEASDGKYLPGDLIGKAGIERNQDSLLRGIQGEKYVLMDVHNREVGSYAEGQRDRKAIRGKDLILGIETELQALGEELMQNKKGSIVAIEPSTGEILAFVSAPSYDPSMLTGRELMANWNGLTHDSLKPLYNRPLQATYPPGSIFKLANALAGLNEGIIVPETRYGCGGGFMRNRGKPGCHAHPGPLDLEGAIQHSCNAYFSAVYMDFLHSPKYSDIYQAFDTWHNYMALMGIGQKLHIDLPYERTGLLPSSEMYDNQKRWYGHNRWNALTIISNAIGQGEILMTPLQMANLATLIANRGWYIEPHFVRGMRNPGDPVWQKVSYPRVSPNIERRHFEFVIEAMEKVVSSGTARRAFMEEIAICGKTGTVENPHGANHSVFVCFAPKENPKIAMAVVVENSGSGGTWAAPICATMIEYYLKRKVEAKLVEYQRVKEANFLR